MHTLFYINGMVLVLLTGQAAQAQESSPGKENAKTLAQPSAIDIDQLKVQTGSELDRQQKEAKPTTLPIVVERLDGAPNAEAALNAMVAASNAGDHDAAFLLVDPEIRPLLIRNIAIERFAIESAILERAFFGERDFEVGGMLFVFTRRDLVRIRTVKLLETRAVDDQRVVFTVLTTEKSYADEHIHNVRQFLAVERSGKWYLFRPFGMLTQVLREMSLGSNEAKSKSMLETKRSTPDSPNRENAEYEIQYHVPIEAIHECLTKAAKHPGFSKCRRLAEKLDRSLESVKHRAIRDDYSTRGEMLAALKPAKAWLEELADIDCELEQALQKLAAQQLNQPETPSK